MVALTVCRDVAETPLRASLSGEGPNVANMFPFRRRHHLMVCPSAIQSFDRIPLHSGPSSSVLLDQVQLTVANL